MFGTDNKSTFRFETIETAAFSYKYNQFELGRYRLLFLKRNKFIFIQKWSK